MPAKKSAEQEENKKTEATEEEKSTELAGTAPTDLENFNLGDLSEYGFDEKELENLSGLETINAGDIRVPYGKFWAITKDGREAGDIELPDGTIIKGAKGETLKGLSILKIQTVRVMFPQPYKPSNSFICRSLDGKVGAEDGKYAGRSCAACEWSKFPEDGGPSPCREQILLLCTLPDGTMFHLLVSGIGVGEFKETFLSTEMMKGLALVKKKLKASVLGALNVNVTVGYKNTAYGEKPKPIFRVDKEQPLVPKERLLANLDSYSSYKEFENEATSTAANFAQHEQGEQDTEEAEEAGQNSGMF